MFLDDEKPMPTDGGAMPAGDEGTEGAGEDQGGQPM